MKALHYHSLHSHPKGRSLLPSNSDRWFTLSWVPHIPWGPIKNLRTVHFLMSEVVYFPGILYCCLEGLIFNFASKVVFLLGKPFAFFYFFIQSALNNNVLQFSPISPSSWSLKEKKSSFGVPLRTPCYEFWKHCQSELVAFTNLKQILFQSTLPAIQGNWKASLKNLLMCSLKLTKAAEAVS